MDIWSMLISGAMPILLLIGYQPTPTSPASTNASSLCELERLSNRLNFITLKQQAATLNLVAYNSGRRLNENPLTIAADFRYKYVSLTPEDTLVKDLYLCDINTKKPLIKRKPTSTKDMAFQEQQMYVNKLKQKKGASIGLCPAEEYQESKPFTIQTNQLFAKCLESPQQLDTQFTWHPLLQHKYTTDMIDLAVQSINMDMSYSTVYNTLQGQSDPSVCLLEETDNPTNTNTTVNLSDKVYPFKNSRDLDLDIRRFKQIQNSPAIDNPGYTFLGEMLNTCNSYKELYSNPLSNTTSILSSDMYEKLDRLFAEKNAFEKKLAQRIKDMEADTDQRLTINEYVEIIERALVLELNTLDLLICDLSTNTLKAAISNIIAKASSSNTLPVKNPKRIKELMINIVEATIKRTDQYNSIIQSLTETALSLIDKEKMLVFHPTTFYPSKKMANTIVTAAWLRICDLGKRTEALKLEGQKVIRGINKIKAKKTTPSTEVRQHLKDYLQEVTDYMLKAEMQSLQHYMSYINYLSLDIDVITDELTTLKEYQTCHRVQENGHWPPMEKSIARQLLNKILIRENIKSQQTYILYRLKNTFMIRHMDEDIALLNLFDIFDKDAIIAKFPTMPNRIKSNLKDYMPEPVQHSLQEENHCQGYSPAIQPDTYDLSDLQKRINLMSQTAKATEQRQIQEGIALAQGTPSI